jgi:hypothetical protein
VVERNSWWLKPHPAGIASSVGSLEGKCFCPCAKFFPQAAPRFQARNWPSKARQARAASGSVFRPALEDIPQAFLTASAASPRPRL